MTETSIANNGIRTEKNVIESDGTLILNVGQVSSGTAYTIKMAKRNKKSFLVVQLDQETSNEVALDWLATNKIEVLNVAGPRESKIPGIHAVPSALLRYPRCLLALLVVVPLGFYTKFYVGYAQSWVRDSLGGVFYKIFWCLVVCLFCRSLRIGVIAAMVLSGTCCLEFLQLWHPPFLEYLYPGKRHLLSSL